jgi:branched-chain amino acid transport system substrate-binding protein
MDKRAFGILFGCLVIFSLIVPCHAFAVYKLGAVTAGTGPYAAQGVSSNEGILLLLEKINNAGGINSEKIEVIIEDFEGEPSKALTLAKKLIYEDKVIGIIGASNTAGSMAVSRICNEAKVPHIQLAPKPSTEPWQKFTFQDVPDNDVDAEAIANFVTKELRLKKPAIIHDTNAYGTTGAESQVKIFEKMGIKVVAVEKYKQEDRDLTASLLKIKNLGANCIIVWGTVNVPPIIARDMKKLDIKMPFVGSTGVLNPKFMELAGDAANGCYITSSLNFGAPLPSQQELFKLCRAKYNKDPNHFTALGYDAVLLFVKAIEVAKSKDPEKIRDALENIKNFPGAVGTYNMSPQDHMGLTYKDIKIVRIVDGKPMAIKK